MSRITVWRRDDQGNRISKTGWFDTATAEWWEHPSKPHRVWLTPSDRWAWTAGDICEYLTHDQARETLTEWGYRADADDRIARANVGPGRPEIGPEVKTRLPDAVLAALDAMAKANGVTRAEQIRQLVTDGVYLST